MKAILFNTTEERDAFNSAEATHRGCRGKTLYWYGTYENAVIVNDDLPQHKDDYEITEIEIIEETEI